MFFSLLQFSSGFKLHDFQFCQRCPLWGHKQRCIFWSSGILLNILFMRSIACFKMCLKLYKNLLSSFPCFWCNTLNSLSNIFIVKSFLILKLFEMDWEALCSLAPKMRTVWMDKCRLWHAEVFQLSGVPLCIRSAKPGLPKMWVTIRSVFVA